jgi:uncharacterized damage-inducible protein DinB
MSAGQRDILLDMLDRAYDVRSWHGANLRGSIRGVSAEEAAWRPAADRHNIHELVLHAAYWKYIARRRMLGEKRGSFPLKGSDWFERPSNAVSDEEWKSDVGVLDETHAALRQAVASLPAKRLREMAQKGFDNAGLITGVAAHDLYHAGQIQLLKRLRQSAGP